jgi:hypothetical protein
MRKKNVGSKLIVIYSILVTLMLISILATPISNSKITNSSQNLNDKITFETPNPDYNIIEPIYFPEPTNSITIPTENKQLLDTPFNIPLTGKLANSWVWVSFPVNVSGPIQNVLNDTAYGDGLTTWSVAKWYDARDPYDHWKTYRVGSTVNDLITIDNTMSVWLWITANGGDQKLSISYGGGNMSSATEIEIVAGWNMIGYPSSTPRLGSLVFPPYVDIISIYWPTPPYIRDFPPNQVTLSACNGYFVHSTVNFIVTIPAS